MSGLTPDNQNATEGAHEKRPQSSPTQILIIGYGNTLRQDDGLGVIAAGQLAQQYSSNPQVDVITCHQLTMDLAERLSSANVAILIDAQRGDLPGQIITRTIQPDQTLADTMHHHMEPEALLAYTLALYGQAPHTHLFTITAASFDFGESLSQPVQAALPNLLAQITQTIQSTLGYSLNWWLV